MAKLTLLQMTQNILSAMNSDVVDTINATQESTLVAQIIEDVYFKFIHERDWPHLHNIGHLTGLADVTQPAKMQIPENVSRVAWIKYDVRLAIADARIMRDLQYLPPLDFISMISARDQNLTNVTEYTDSGSTVVLNIYTDRHPTYWTSFDDNYIWFDSYYTTLDSTLQGSKTMVEWVAEPTWTPSDGFIPNLPQHMFPAFLAECKVQCFSKIKQSIDQLEARDAKRQKIALQHAASKENLPVPAGADMFGGRNQEFTFGRR